MGWLIFKYLSSGDVARLRNETCFFYFISLLVRLNFAHMVLATDGKDMSLKVEVNYHNISFYTEFQIFELCRWQHEQ